MVVKKIVGALFISCSVVSCFDSFYGPQLTNALGFDVEVIVDDDLGRSLTSNWPACRTVFFGNKQRRIQKIVIQKDGKILQTINGDEARNLANTVEKTGGTSNWMVDETGIHRASDGTTAACVNKH